MIDIVLCNVPLVKTNEPFSAPAILKAIVEKNNFTAKTFDFNIEFNNLNQTSNIENFWQFGQSADKKIVDEAHQYAEKWAGKILQCNPKWVGISVFAYTCKTATEILCMILKNENPKIKIVLGGNGMATGGINGDFKWSNQLIKSKKIDAYIRSEAEESLIQLLKGNISFPGINDNEKNTQIDDLDSYPIPNYKDYDTLNYSLKRLPITGSRGCVRHCTFCDVHSHWKKFVFRSGESICNEMKILSKTHNIYHFSFTDSLINGSMKSYRDMIKSLSEYNKSANKKITWNGQFIARSSSQMSETDWHLTKLAGAKSLSIGVESGSDKIRKDINKKFTNKDLDFCVQMAFKYNIRLEFLMLIGYPTESQDDFNETIKMFTKYEKYKDNIIPYLGTTVAILPQTPLYDFAIKNHFVLGNTENEWWWDQNPDLTLKERFKRRIVLGKHCKKLGYDVQDKKELETMAYMWNNYKLNQVLDKSKLHHNSTENRNMQYYS